MQIALEITKHLFSDSSFLKTQVAWLTSIWGSVVFSNIHAKQMFGVDLLTGISTYLTFAVWLSGLVYTILKSIEVYRNLKKRDD